MYILLYCNNIVQYKTNNKEEFNLQTSKLLDKIKKHSLTVAILTVIRKVLTILVSRYARKFTLNFPGKFSCYGP